MDASLPHQPQHLAQGSSRLELCLVQEIGEIEDLLRRWQAQPQDVRFLSEARYLEMLNEKRLMLDLLRGRDGVFRP